MPGRGGRLAGPFRGDAALSSGASPVPPARAPRSESQPGPPTQRRRARAEPSGRSPPELKAKASAKANAWMGPGGGGEEEEEEAEAKKKAKAKEKEPAKQLPVKRRRPPLKPKGSCSSSSHHPRKRDPLPYAAGSLEEQWHLVILDRGRVTCPVCRVATRKTVEGLKKHMANCQQEMFTCHHCGKQLRSLAGMKYHLMADHNTLLTGKDKGPQDKQSERERLRQVLKRLGKLRCTREGCTGSFTSIVGYLYHTQKCGKAAAELETLVLRCPHCGKAYRSRAGLVYHMKSEHGPAPFLHKDVPAGPPKDTCAEANGGRRLQRKSAKVAAYYLHELAHVELAKEWPKRKVLQDLVPDDRKLKYTRPGLPAVSQEVLCKWRAEIKAYQQVQCPNQGCTCVYSSVSGLKAHLGSCTLGEFVAGKYRCRLCTKEFVSESGVKYHINAVHAEDWFEVSTTGSKRLTKQARPPPQPEEATRAMQQQHRRKKALASRRKRRPPPLPPPPPPPPSTICPKRHPRLGPDPSHHPGIKGCFRSRVPGSESWSSGEEAAVSPPPMKPSHKRRRK